ncbi:MAG: ATPase associated with various cellular 3 [Myxococcales bacterium]|nr:ATPase associated with various cellular 3 [Myxococcales bacterium]
MSDRLTEDVTKFQGRFASLKAEVGKVLVGQDEMLHRLLLGLLAGGHVLLEGVPGLAKTLAIRTLADALDGTFSRIQFTPDMLPGDVIGTQIFNPREGNYSIKRGPVFGNFILADEINRAPAKVQSALLEAMQEQQVTLGDQTMKLAEPFLVLATQNPIEQEGTYPLPEAQLDRFMLKIKVGYPTKDEEVKIIDRMAGSGSEPRASKVLTCDEILAARDVVRQIFVDDKVKRYAVDVVSATRDPKAAGMAPLASLIDNGASVRASIALIKVAKAQALLSGRSYISPHDVKTIAHDVLRHRILASYEAEAQGKTTDHVIAQILENVLVP